MRSEKKCNKCEKIKFIPDDFYFYVGRYRPACKACQIKINMKRQKVNGRWKPRLVENNERRPYMQEYYDKNKAKFKDYRLKNAEKMREYQLMYRTKQKEKRIKNED